MKSSLLWRLSELELPDSFLMHEWMQYMGMTSLWGGPIHNKTLSRVKVPKQWCIYSPDDLSPFAIVCMRYALCLDVGLVCLSSVLVLQLWFHPYNYDFTLTLLWFWFHPLNFLFNFMISVSIKMFIILIYIYIILI